MRSSSIASRSAADTGAANGSIARLQRLVAQQPRAQPAERGHGELLVGRGEPVLDALAQRVRGRFADRQREDRLRPLGLRQVGETLDQRGGLPRARAADDEQRAAGVLDGLALGGGQHGSAPP